MLSDNDCRVLVQMAYPEQTGAAKMNLLRILIEAVANERPVPKGPAPIQYAELHPRVVNNKAPAKKEVPAPLLTTSQKSSSATGTNAAHETKAASGTDKNASGTSRATDTAAKSTAGDAVKTEAKSDSKPDVKEDVK